MFFCVRRIVWRLTAVCHFFSADPAEDLHVFVSFQWKRFRSEGINSSVMRDLALTHYTHSHTKKKKKKR